MKQGNSGKRLFLRMARSNLLARTRGICSPRTQGHALTIPFQDLLVGATALQLGYAVVTGNPRHFRMIPKQRPTHSAFLWTTQRERPLLLTPNEP